MKINIQETRYLEVDVSPEQAIEIASRVIRKVFDLGASCYINSRNQVVYDVKYHSWDEEFVRDATKEDEMAMEVLKAIRKYKE